MSCHRQLISCDHKADDENDESLMSEASRCWILLDLRGTCAANRINDVSECIKPNLHFLSVHTFILFLKSYLLCPPPPRL